MKCKRYDGSTESGQNSGTLWFSNGEWSFILRAGARVLAAGHAPTATAAKRYLAQKTSEKLTWDCTNQIRPKKRINQF